MRINIASRDYLQMLGLLMFVLYSLLGCAAMEPEVVEDSWSWTFLFGVIVPFAILLPELRARKLAGRKGIALYLRASIIIIVFWCIGVALSISLGVSMFWMGNIATISAIAGYLVLRRRLLIITAKHGESSG